MAPSSFGLEPKDKEYILEEIFLLMEYCNISWSEAWDIPIIYRKWLIHRKEEEIKKKAEADKKQKGPAKPAPRKPPRKKR